jgi:hypothetical protein
MSEPAPPPQTARPRSLAGPLFFYDLLRLARRGRSTLLRCTYALTLLGAHCLAYSERFSWDDLWQQPFASRTQVPLWEVAPPPSCGTFPCHSVAGNFRRKAPGGWTRCQRWQWSWRRGWR